MTGPWSRPWSRPWCWPPSRDERGSATVEAVVAVPAFALFVGLIIFGGRTATTHQSIQTAAAEGARAASLARTGSAARTAALTATTTSLSNQGVGCVDLDVKVDAAQFDRTVGQDATVSVTVACRLDLSDLAVPGVPGTQWIKATMTSPVDTFRERG